MVLLALSFLLLHGEAPKQAPSPPAIATRNIVQRLSSQYPKVSPIALTAALQFHKRNQAIMGLSENFLAIADFSKTSDKKRLAIVNLKKQTIEFYKVAHGKGSDPNHDTRLDHFSSRVGSNATPYGFHKMTKTYFGKHGLSLKMQGLEKANSSSMKRAIVLHGAAYVSWKKTGRSLGCPAVEKKYAKKIIEQLKDGALFYHYGNASNNNP